MALPKVPGIWKKGTIVMVSGYNNPCKVLHEFGGEDVGWVRCKTSEGKEIEVKSELLRKMATDIRPVGDAWKTAHGTHIEINKKGNVTKGPAALKAASKSTPKSAEAPKPRAAESTSMEARLSKVKEGIAKLGKTGPQGTQGHVFPKNPVTYANKSARNAAESYMASGKSVSGAKPEKVNPKDLISIQEEISPDIVEKYAKESGHEPVKAVWAKGKLCLVDGNNRAAAALLAGDKDIEVEVYGRPKTKATDIRPVGDGFQGRDVTVVVVGGKWFYKITGDTLRFGPYDSASEAVEAATKAGHRKATDIRPVGDGVAKGSAAFGHEKPMTAGTYLQKCAKAAVKEGESEETFVAQFRPASQATARAAYQEVAKAKDAALAPVGTIASTPQSRSVERNMKAMEAAGKLHTFVKDPRHPLECKVCGGEVSGSKHSTDAAFAPVGTPAEKSRYADVKKIQAGYNPEAVQKAINSSSKKIGKKEATLIHRLLQGRTGDGSGSDVKCPICKGTGKTVAGWPCKNCGGEEMLNRITDRRTKLHKALDRVMDAKAKDALRTQLVQKTCPRCVNGMGKRGVCLLCKGTGKINSVENVESAEDLQPTVYMQGSSKATDAKGERWASGPGIMLKADERLCPRCKGYTSFMVPGMKTPMRCTQCTGGVVAKVAKATDSNGIFENAKNFAIMVKKATPNVAEDFAAFYTKKSPDGEAFLSYVWPEFARSAKDVAPVGDAGNIQDASASELRAAKKALEERLAATASSAMKSVIKRDIAMVEKYLAKAKDTIEKVGSQYKTGSGLSNACTQCNGTGRKMISGQNRVCPSCNGSGRSSNTYRVADSTYDFNTEREAKDVEPSSLDLHKALDAVLDRRRAKDVGKPVHLDPLNELRLAVRTAARYGSEREVTTAKRKLAEAERAAD